MGWPTALQQLRTATPDDPLFALSLSTHPPAQQRLDQLTQWPWADRLDGAGWQATGATGASGYLAERVKT
jgi:hypothetical protein